jgi:rhamnopyranosyl-N-acetylglucosaminyl-diphospho-decaprenol beta-1,3/1,4-galactofuranosyltransferase
VDVDRDGQEPARTVVAVVVTHDRAALLRRCLQALRAQRRAPDAVVVVDDASPGPDTAAAVAASPGVRHLRHAANRGGAAAYRTGIEAALAAGADLVWLMDDDARPAHAGCLERLIALAEAGTGIAAPLVLDGDDPERLAFPIRLAGRTRFRVAELGAATRVEGFAHLFNGALVRSEVFGAVGLPDPRFVGRGDEVEFMLRALRAGVAVRIDTAARFLHPGSRPEIHPILFGAFYATVPLTEAKRRLQFRNRGHIFRAYGMWHYLAADVVRYGCHYLLRSRPDPLGFWRWLTATAAGWGGGFMRASGPPRDYVLPAAPQSGEGDAGLRRDALPAREGNGPMTGPPMGTCQAGRAASGPPRHRAEDARAERADG